MKETIIAIFISLLLGAFMLIKIQEAYCISKGYSNGDIEGCYIRMNNERVRVIPNY